MQEGQSSVDNRQSLLGLGKGWTRAGYAVLAITILALVLFHTVHPIFSLPPGQSVPEGYRLVAGKNPGKEGGMVVRASALGATSAFLWIFSSLLGFVWTFVDLIDRRKRFVWLLPMFVCPVIFSLQALPLALYMFYGRETVGHGEGVK